MHVKSTVASGNTAMCSWLDISIMSIPLFRHSAVSPGPVRGGGGGGDQKYIFSGKIKGAQYVLWLLGSGSPQLC